MKITIDQTIKSILSTKAQKALKEHILFETSNSYDAELIKSATVVLDGTEVLISYLDNTKYDISRTWLTMEELIWLTIERMGLE